MDDVPNPLTNVISSCIPADELQCACDVPHCPVPTCTGKVCFVSKRKEAGRVTQHKGCFSDHLLENCQSSVMEHFGTRCCNASMCNAELQIYLQGTGLWAVPSEEHGGCGDGVSRSSPSLLGISRVTFSHVGWVPPPGASPWVVSAELPSMGDPNAGPPSPCQS